MSKVRYWRTAEPDEDYERVTVSGNTATVTCACTMQPVPLYFFDPIASEVVECASCGTEYRVRITVEARKWQGPSY